MSRSKTEDAETRVLRLSTSFVDHLTTSQLLALVTASTARTSGAVKLGMLGLTTLGALLAQKMLDIASQIDAVKPLQPPTLPQPVRHAAYAAIESIPQAVAELDRDGFTSAHLAIYEGCAVLGPVVSGAPYREARALLLCLLEAARAERLRVEAAKRAAG